MLLLAAALIVSLAACGGTEAEADPDTGAETAGEPAGPAVSEEDAVDATARDVYDAVQENEARAMQTTYRVTGSVDEINADHCVIDSLRVYLPAEELAELNPGDTLTFIGAVSGTEEETVTMGGGSHTTTWIDFADAQRTETPESALATAAPTVLDEDAYLTGLVERQHTNGLPEGAKGIAVYGLELAKADNPARLAQDYGGQFCQISGIVFSIESDGIVLGYTQFNASGDLGAIGANGGVKVELSADDLAALSALDDVTVTGTFQADDSGTWAAILTDGAVVS